MSLLSPQVAAFIAVIEEASFEAAAKRLSVTPSAISQRIKTLEDRIGQLLVVRQTPCKPTPAGEKLLSKVKPMALLESEVMADFVPDDRQHNQRFSLAVNEDSLSTWLIPALTGLHQQHGHLFDLCVDDQDYTLDYLKNGTAIGALTSEKTPLQGCRSHLLGNMHYCAVASAQFAERYFAKGLTTEAFRRAPMIAYNRKDPLQTRFIHKLTGKHLTPEQVHYMPNSVGLVTGAAQHMGWCMVAEGLLDNALQSGQVVQLAPDVWLDEPLYWQHAAVQSKLLEQITRALFSAAQSELYL
ncbi:transcriptional regulator, LysR family [Vibrio xiamenensis]|uniref:Transcriptional regulator, LysR family n=1 Tax=Vibrio xiamenensis TaxID=861298 RepID=A0A1G7XLP2_9VIBR|nr:LysR family transcriptional regulator ArgP [Vibrio xiamenensis]SDG85105.1 transcriptional regulator, LysR family [Vibrio xiamenensis]